MSKRLFQLIAEADEAETKFLHEQAARLEQIEKLIDKKLKRNPSGNFSRNDLLYFKRLQLRKAFSPRQHLPTIL